MPNFARSRCLKGAVLAAAACLAAAPPAAALINPRYTPVDLVRQSDVILELELGPLADGGRLPVRIVGALKGAAPAAFPIDLARTDVNVIARLREAFAAAPDSKAAAIVFEGTYRDVLSDAVSEAAAVEQKPALLRVEGQSKQWFALRRAAGAEAWSLGPDELDMQAVWAGGARMLGRAVEYILADPEAAIPVAEGVAWGAKVPLAMLGDEVRAMMAVDVDGRGGADLFILSGDGDRLVRFDRASRQFADLAPGRKLESKSRAAAWGDFTGRGRLDLVSWDGRALVLWSQAADGSFSARTLPPAPAACLGLAAVAGEHGRAAILLSTAGPPVLIEAADDGTVCQKALADAAAFPGADLGEAGPCLAADFDGDGRADLVQPLARGALFYRGKGGGVFDAPRPAGGLLAGPRDVRAAAGDFDGDGLLDVFATGSGGCHLWRNLGDGRLWSAVEASGEIPYISKPAAIGAATGDINGDGRRDLLILYSNIAPQIFFNRGFACFGYAVGLDLVETDALPDSGEGVQAGTLADLDGDGAEDLALVLRSGQAWALLRQAWALLGKGGEAPPCGVRVALKPGGGLAGPVAVTGWSGGWSLGSVSVAAGDAGALVGLARPGPLRLTWRTPAGEPREAQIIVEPGARTVWLGASGLSASGPEAPRPEVPPPPAAPAKAEAPPAPAPAKAEAPAPTAAPPARGEGLLTTVLAGAVTVVLAAGAIILVLGRTRRRS